jgi:hypothetical protein
MTSGTPLITARTEGTMTTMADGAVTKSNPTTTIGTTTATTTTTTTTPAINTPTTTTSTTTTEAPMTTRLTKPPTSPMLMMDASPPPTATETVSPTTTPNMQEPTVTARSSFPPTVFVDDGPQLSTVTTTPKPTLPVDGGLPTGLTQPTQFRKRQSSSCFCSPANVVVVRTTTRTTTRTAESNDDRIASEAMTVIDPVILGAGIGGGVGCLLLLAVALGAFYIFRRRRPTNQDDTDDVSLSSVSPRYSSIPRAPQPPAAEPYVKGDVTTVEAAADSADSSAVAVQPQPHSYGAISIASTVSQFY